MDTGQLWNQLQALFGQNFGLKLVQALLILAMGLIITRLAGIVLQRAFSRWPVHWGLLVQRGATYLLAGLFVLAALTQLGLNLGLMLGTAGVLTVALGFAAQTSMSNLISGLFLIGERPFAIGDVIRVGETVGEVLSIDLLSIKLRKFDNTFVRIPNETIIKTEVATLTKFPIRRIDVRLNISLTQDIERVKQVLFDTADANPMVMQEPAPLFIFQGFGDAGLAIQFSVWAQREQFLAVQNSIMLDIKAAFDREGVDLGLPYRSLAVGRAGEPLPVRVVADNDG
ncbi:MAG: Small-conductance mechanosensitive channel [Anaerolineae bacterium]|nr:Small-conductance mechanosensitive channel [Anaerolineae bacterium]